MVMVEMDFFVLVGEENCGHWILFDHLVQDGPK
jgi:hypothetical protein